jgi:hypothetical protein
LPLSQKCIGKICLFEKVSKNFVGLKMGILGSFCGLFDAKCEHAAGCQQTHGGVLNKKQKKSKKS